MALMPVAAAANPRKRAVNFMVINNNKLWLNKYRGWSFSPLDLFMRVFSMAFM
ncbi:hypothetical protein ACHAXM_002502 [Skeletonema potamos]